MSEGESLRIRPGVQLPLEEIELRAQRASGPGGQHVNTTSSAILLRFDVRASSLSESHRDRILAHRDGRIGEDGVIVIRAQEHRSQLRNREAALERLADLLSQALRQQAKRRPTRPSRGVRARRLEAKNRRGSLKQQRRRPDAE